MIFVTLQVAEWEISHMPMRYPVFYSDIQKFFDNLDVIYFIEEFRRPEKETKPLEEEQKQDDEKEDNQ